MTYLTQLNLDFATAARLPLRDSYAWHQAIWHAFPGRGDSPRDFLTRLDRRQDGFRLLIVSPIEPTRPNWCPPDPGSWQTKAIPDTYFSRRRYAFQLCVNPTKKVAKLNSDGSKTKNGRRVPLSTREEMLAWIVRKGEQGGFAVDVEKTRTYSRGREYFQKQASIGSAQCCGISRHSQRDRYYGFSPHVHSRYRVGQGIRLWAAGYCANPIGSTRRKDSYVKLIELHILQSFPVSCLNRDDVGAPKTATFGGVSRARISSQCLKRAIRELAKETAPNLFAGDRSRLIITPLAKKLTSYGVAEEKSVEVAKQIGDYLATLDPAAEKKGDLKVKTMMFLSPAEVDFVAKELAEVIKKKHTEKELQKAAVKACKSAALKDAADIAIFGRMVASDHSLTIEGAGLFSHALSTHKADNDIDFFSAVDDLQSEDEAGAGITGTLEFTSATYYRYIALNLGMLSDDAHLSDTKPGGA